MLVANRTMLQTPLWIVVKMIEHCSEEDIFNEMFWKIINKCMMWREHKLWMVYGQAELHCFTAPQILWQWMCRRSVLHPDTVAMDVQKEHTASRYCGNGCAEGAYRIQIMQQWMCRRRILHPRYCSNGCSEGEYCTPDTAAMDVQKENTAPQILQQWMCRRSLHILIIDGVSEMSTLVSRHPLHDHYYFSHWISIFHFDASHEPSKLHI